MENGPTHGFNAHVFVYSCSGSKIFRHNLNLQTIFASKRNVHIQNMIGDAFITTMAADTVTVGSTEAAGTFKLIVDSPISAT